ncbi:class E sortase [Actinacidiphila acididurans]|uniref:Class E sortase n=1 Tax=Actinacidiphila acididurans TaxID=2784346 RepID=A0ABS2TRF1_9ACTN|nr:class E sortase [Actinacidiphila acididurans]MBM9505918.1 class E sortase [Actinacidiphila acididurans]
MTTLRPERPADGPMSYEDTGEFRAVVESLNDPLNDPLPGQRPAQAPAPAPAPAPTPAPAPAQAQAQQPSPPSAPSGEAPRRARRAHARPEPDGYEQPPVFATAPPVDVPPAPVAAPADVRPPAHAAAPADVLPPAPMAAPTDVPPAPAPAPAGPAPAVPPQMPFGPPEPPEAYAPDDAVQETAKLPVVSLEALGAAAGGGPEIAVDSGPAPVVAPADGGRAARRKAARAGGGHRAGARTGTAQPGAEAALAPGEGAAPLSRVEARRAQKAAKDSPAVVLSRVVGELFITTGVLMLLFVTYQLWWTNVRAHAEAAGAANHLQKEWNSASNDPNRAPGVFQPGQGFAIMYIPKLDVKAPIAQGVDKHSVLDKGEIGHYDGALNTAMPWDKTGNFAVAAHRNTHGEPFRYINRLVPGDKVVVETASAYYTYQITSSLPSTSPSNVSVLQPVPVGSGFTGPGRYLTLTTCTPEFTSKYRLIVWGKLIEQRPRSEGKPDALLNG